MLNKTHFTFVLESAFHGIRRKYIKGKVMPRNAAKQTPISGFRSWGSCQGCCPKTAAHSPCLPLPLGPSGGRPEWGRRGSVEGKRPWACVSESYPTPRGPAFRSRAVRDPCAPVPPCTGALRWPLRRRRQGH